MALWLRQSTASQEILLGRFVDSTDGDSEETGLTIANTDIKLWKHGATTLASKNSGGATHIANGLYYAVLDATDTDTLGDLEVHVHVSGALAVRREFIVVPAVVFDSMILGTDVFQADVTQFGGSNITSASGIPEVKVASLASGSITASVIADAAIDNATFAADVGSTAIATNVIGIAAAKGVANELNVTTYAEIGQEAPAATQTMRKMLGYLYKTLRNKKTQTSTTWSLYNDAESTVDQKRTVSDNGTTATIGEIATGP